MSQRRHLRHIGGAFKVELGGLDPCPVDSEKGGRQAKRRPPEPYEFPISLSSSPNRKHMGMSLGLSCR